MERTTLIRYFRQFGERASESTEMLNPLFGGRDEELAVLHNNVRVAVESTPVNRTAIVHGAPGAGKSELKTQFLSQVIEQHGSYVIPVSASDAEVGDATILMRSLLSQLSDELKNRTDVIRIINELKNDRWHTFFGTRATLDKQDSQPESTARYTQLGWFQTHANKLPSQVKKCVFVLCVDEFQALDNPSQSLCRFLHSYDLGLQIVPFYFGLSDVPDVLRNAGVSRTLSENSLALSSLNAEDAASIVRVFCAGLKIEFSEPTIRSRIAEDVAAQCDCWPHHIASWMRAACVVLPKYDFKMTTATLAEINDICTKYRRIYYDDRVRGPSSLSSRAGSRAFVDLLRSRNVVDEDEINSALMPALEKVHRQFDIEKFIEEAVHAGVLERVGRGQYRVPIPSLADYIYEESRPVA